MVFIWRILQTFHSLSRSLNRIIRQDDRWQKFKLYIHSGETNLVAVIKFRYLFSREKCHNCIENNSRPSSNERNEEKGSKSMVSEH